ncbi:hypothetical protein IJ531_06825, partial [bacterium]|nr:hypothetical protein [bacterium]
TIPITIPTAATTAPTVPTAAPAIVTTAPLPTVAMDVIQKSINSSFVFKNEPQSTSIPSAPIDRAKEIVGAAMQAASDELLKNSYDKINESKINDIFFNEEAAKNPQKEQYNMQESIDDLINKVSNELETKNQVQESFEEVQSPNEVQIQEDVPRQTIEIKEDITVAPLQVQPQINSYSEAQPIEQFIEQPQVQYQELAQEQSFVQPQEQTAPRIEPLQHEQVQNTNPIDTEEEIEEEQKNSRIPSLSFSMFLGGFVTSDIHDEFIICAFYIKNILRQNNFTMKFINSKLFQATGKIADMSIVDELVEKEYIKTMQSDDHTRYAIAAKGEEYLISKLQS